MQRKTKYGRVRNWQFSKHSCTIEKKGGKPGSVKVLRGEYPPAGSKDFSTKGFAAQ